MKMKARELRFSTTTSGSSCVRVRTLIPANNPLLLAAPDRSANNRAIDPLPVPQRRGKKSRQILTRLAVFLSLRNVGDNWPIFARDFLSTASWRLHSKGPGFLTRSCSNSKGSPFPFSRTGEEHVDLWSKDKLNSAYFAYCTCSRNSRGKEFENLEMSLSSYTLSSP